MNQAPPIPASDVNGILPEEDPMGNLWPKKGAPERSGKSRPSLEILRWQDFKDEEVPSVEYVLDPFLPRISFGIIASQPGHGKSFLALQVAVAVATGLPVFGIEACGPAGAGVLALEDDPNVVKRRVQAIRTAYGSQWTPQHDQLMEANLRLMVRAKAPLASLDGMAAAHTLGTLARELGEAMEGTHPACVFLDTLNAIHGSDENDNTAVRGLVATILGLADSLGCSVWALHHLRKAGMGKTAPALADRMDPELVRGAGALVASARAVVQFGWIYGPEAGKVGLEPINSTRRYVLMALTKVNDGPLSRWSLMEHTSPAGLLAPVPHEEEMVAALRGGNASANLQQAEILLLDIHNGLSRSELAEKHWPGNPKAGDRLKGALQDIRRRHGWLQPGNRSGELKLTVKGMEKAQELGRQADETAYPQEGEDEC